MECLHDDTLDNVAVCAVEDSHSNGYGPDRNIQHDRSCFSISAHTVCAFPFKCKLANANGPSSLIHRSCTGFLLSPHDRYGVGSNACHRPVAGVWQLNCIPGPMPPPSPNWDHSPLRGFPLHVPQLRWRHQPQAKTAHELRVRLHLWSFGQGNLIASVKHK